MASFKRVVVEFDPQSSVRRVTVVPQRGVQAIFLDGAEKEFLKDKKPRRVTTPPPEVMVEGQIPLKAADNGDDTPVCYLINGELLCW